MKPVSPKQTSDLLILLIVVAIIGIATILTERVIDSRPIKLVAEDYSLYGGITPEQYFGIHRVINQETTKEELKLLGKKFNTVYSGKLPGKFDCYRYKRENIKNKYTDCSRGPSSIKIMSNTPLDSRFSVDDK